MDEKIGRGQQGKKNPLPNVFGERLSGKGLMRVCLPPTLAACTVLYCTVQYTVVSYVQYSSTEASPLLWRRRMNKKSSLED